MRNPVPATEPEVGGQSGDKFPRGPRMSPRSIK